MADIAVPTEISDWMTQLQWPEHHVEWHAVRQWDLLSPSERQELIDRGWHRAARQEGAPGNGFDFLLMHRAMLELLREQFPQYSGLFVGWLNLPTDPDDISDPVPPQNVRAFNPDKLQAISRLTM